MTEDYWQKFKKNKEATKNQLVEDVESELKRRFKAEKSPEEMLSMCKTDNNYWKQYRLSERLDDDSVATVMCKLAGCEMMYCQALTFGKQARNKEIETHGCTEQFNSFRECYLREKRKFNATVKERDWKEDGNVIPQYLKEQMLIQKEAESKRIVSEHSEKSRKEEAKIYEENVKSYVNQLEQQKVGMGVDIGRSRAGKGDGYL
eukprot:CAMPEP_0170515378 /NCGR_PEP_ID=MMETSP0209-20121228/1822_1 /TAXON_ID=665100 ORGANISM="Litonotus pictus, Strain P1" /NCGR_SAMPLE_ID=MMETSP0209 /ASSEMBLY_ACC=CAM_ASM_000301 /LENGTH=203 /DNA_ID=CAMNT_0010799835 /DNA_START=3 /DNA_END=614 /DNA_ORIENTATION=-